MARLTVERPTPASAAMWSIVRVQRPCFTCSAAATASTAVSAAVNRHARLGGSRPPAAHRRRPAGLSGALGRDPTRRRGGGALEAPHPAFLASIRADRSAAWSSVTCPAAYALQSKPD